MHRHIRTGFRKAVSDIVNVSVVLDQFKKRPSIIGLLLEGLLIVMAKKHLLCDLLTYTQLDRIEFLTNLGYNKLSF